MTQQRYLVTAGGTREHVDDVRTLTNVATGATGLAIALALTRLGSVDLLTSRPDLIPPAGRPPNLHVTAFGSHADLEQALHQHLGVHPYRGVVMSAAVSDYRPAGVWELISSQPQSDGTELWSVRRADQPRASVDQPHATVDHVNADRPAGGKVSSAIERIAIEARRTTKLIAQLRDWGRIDLLVGFKLLADVPDDHLLDVARRSAQTARADWVVANTLAHARGQVTTHNPRGRCGAYLVAANQCEWCERDNLPAALGRLLAPPEAGAKA